MRLADCFSHMIARWTDALVVTSAGQSSGTWWNLSKDRDRVFYLTASMSLSTMFASGIAFGHPKLPVWAFSGDGAFVMNPGMLFVERQMNLPNLKHFLVANRCYASTDEVDIPFAGFVDYAALARAAGIERVYDFHDIDDFRSRFDEAVMRPGHTFVVLHVEQTGTEMRTATMDGPEVKFRFGRHIEDATGVKLFNVP